MIGWLILLLRLAVTAVNGRRNLVLENLVLRHQLLVLDSTARSRLPLSVPAALG